MEAVSGGMGERNDSLRKNENNFSEKVKR